MRWWIKMLAVLVVLALLAWLGWGLVQGLTSLLGNMDLIAGEKDPMFAEEAVNPTRPPELDEQEEFRQRPTLDDYVAEEGAPVDKTAEELIREAQIKNEDV